MLILLDLITASAANIFLRYKLFQFVDFAKHLEVLFNNGVFLFLAFLHMANVSASLAFLSPRTLRFIYILSMYIAVLLTACVLELNDGIMMMMNDDDD